MKNESLCATPGAATWYDWPMVKLHVAPPMHTGYMLVVMLMWQITVGLGLLPSGMSSQW